MALSYVGPSSFNNPHWPGTHIICLIFTALKAQFGFSHKVGFSPGLD